MVLLTFICYVALHGITVNDTMERMWNETVVDYFKVLSQHSPGETKRDDETPQSEQLVSGLRFKTGIY
jgi:hypothetical protein